MMSIFYAYLSFDDDTKLSWCQQTTLTNFLTPLFYDLTTSPTNVLSTDNFNNVREEMRNFLSDCDPTNFPRYGPVGAPAQLIFDYLKRPDDTNICISPSCSSLTTSSTITSRICNAIPTTLLPSLWLNWCETNNRNNIPEYATIQQWIDLYVENIKNTQGPLIHHENCFDNHNPSSCRVYIDKPPPLLMFDVTPNTSPKPIPSQTISFNTQFSNTIYKLRAIIYYGDFHFTARLIHNDNFWTYDGQINNGYPSQEQFLPHVDIFHTITTLHHRHAHLYIYSL